MGLLEWVFGPSVRVRNNVVLLVKVRRDDDTTDERRVVVEEREINQICDEAMAEVDAKEIWVYRKIFHYTRPEPDDNDPFIMGMAMGAGTMFRNK